MKWFTSLRFYPPGSTPAGFSATRSGSVFLPTQSLNFPSHECVPPMNRNTAAKQVDSNQAAFPTFETLVGNSNPTKELL